MAVFNKVYYQELKGKQVRYTRTNNDVYGNPLYKVEPVNFEWQPSKFNAVVKNWHTKKYWLLQSYDITGDVKGLLKAVQA